MIETILKLDQPTWETGLIYPRSVVEQALENPPQWLVLDKPSDSDIRLDRVAGRVVRLFIEDDELKAEFELNNTPMGAIIQSLSDNHVRLSYRPCESGTVSNNVVSDLVISFLWADPRTTF